MPGLPTDHQATKFLLAMSKGDVHAGEKLMPLVYQSLEQIARRHLRYERSNHTLDTSALVHEAYLKLVIQQEADWKNRAHFFAIASQAMRRILINYAHKRKAEKRGGGQVASTLQEEFLQPDHRPERLLALDEALNRLAGFSERQAEVVVMRFFGGLKEEEIAEVLGVSGPTVRRDWRFAKAWLNKELAE
ncbi:MAG: sigma-70 family RNA polymerase sigma factor [Bacteroidota bacterium]